MAAKWQLWMPRHIDRWRGSPAVRAMHPAARDGYWELLCCQWQSDDCSLPSDGMELSEKSGLGDELWAQYGARILRNFEAIEGGRIRNAVCHQEWLTAKAKYEANSSAKSEAGKRGADARWKHDKPMARAIKNDGKKCHTGTVTVTETKELKAKAQAPSFLPPWISASTWDSYEEMRRRIRKPMTDRARELVIAKLGRFREAGEDIEEVLNRSIANGWQDVWATEGRGSGRNRAQERSDSNDEAARRAIAGIYGRASQGSSGGEAGNGRGKDIEAVRASPGSV